MDLRDFLGQFAAAGMLRKIRTAVDPELELAALCRREFAKENNAALLFEELAGNRFRAAANLFGAEARMAGMLRCANFDQFAEKLRVELRKRHGTAAERLKNMAQCAAGHAAVPTPLWCRQPDATLLELPAIKSWPEEGNPYLTLPLVVSRHPQTGTQNLGIYRVQILNENQAAINFQPGSGAGEYLMVAAETGERLPLALVFGGDPALYWLAAAPLPKGCDEYGLFRKLFCEELALSPGNTQKLLIPGDAEFVVEGFFTPGRTCQEGPFGNHTGHYVTRADCPVMEVTSIAWRKQAIMPLTVVGPPPSENIYLGRVNEILIREMLHIDFPEILALHMPELTIFHGVALLQATLDDNGSALELIERLWQDSPLQNSRLLILFDADIDLADYGRTYWRLVNQLDGKRIHQRGKQLAIDATGIDPQRLVVEDRATAELVKRRHSAFEL